MTAEPKRPQTVDDDDEPVFVAESTPPPVEEGAPAWTLTFGDMMSLLLTFFILLYSMSELESEKFQLAAQSLYEGFGESNIDRPEFTRPAPIDSVVPLPPPPGVPDSTTVDAAVGRLLERFEVLLRDFIISNDLEQDIVVNRNEDAVVLSIRDVALFAPGEGFIDPGGEWIIEKLAGITGAIHVPLIIAGHTDSIPIRNNIFRSNWELSAVRAAGIARLLVELGQDPRLVHAEAYGQYRPVASNNDGIGRALNRRVEFYYTRENVMDSYMTSLGR